MLAKAKILLKEIGKLPIINKIVDDVTVTTIIELIEESIAGR